MLEPIQMQLFKNLKIVCQYFAQFLESTSNFQHFEDKDDPRSLCIFEIKDCEMYVRQISKEPHFITPSNCKYVEGSQTLVKSP